jgi:hypothetical protein
LNLQEKVLFLPKIYKKKKEKWIKISFSKILGEKTFSGHFDFSGMATNY